MRAGEIVYCPTCREKTAVKLKNLMDGWKKTGEIFICPVCGAELGRPAPAGNSGESGRAADFAAFLGAETEKAPELTLDAADRRFCRDCRYYIVHPFLSRCDLHDRAADPMGDCADFSPKPQAK